MDGDFDPAQALQQACAEVVSQRSPHLASVGTALRQIPAVDRPRTALIAALEYHLVLEHEDRRYGPFEPMMELGDRVYPAPIDQMAPDMLSTWALAFEEAPLQLVKARFADLLWERKHGDRPHEWAQRAVEAYLTAAEVEEYWNFVEVSEGAQRAFENAARLKDATRLQAAIETLIRLAQRSLRTQDPSPGVSLQILDLLARQPVERRPSECEHLLDEAIDVYRNDPWNLESALDVKARLVSQAERKDLHRQQVEAFADLAQQTAGLKKYAHLQHAIELAELHDIKESAELLRNRVEAMPEEELGLTTVETKIELPREEIDRYFGRIVGDDCLDAALSRFGSELPTLPADDMKEIVRDRMAATPLQFTVTRMVIDAPANGNALISSAQGDDEQEAMAVIRFDADNLELFSIFAMEALERMQQRYGLISDHYMLFETQLIDSAVAERIGQSIAWYEESKFDECGSLLVPRIEKLIRRIAHTTGLAVTNSPGKYGNGGVKGLGAILANLNGILPEQTIRYLRVLLTEPLGVNLRNRIAHGLLDSVTAQQSALLIQAACHLRSIRFSSQAEQD